MTAVVVDMAAAREALRAAVSDLPEIPNQHILDDGMPRAADGVIGLITCAGMMGGPPAAERAAAWIIAAAAGALANVAGRHRMVVLMRAIENNVRVG